MHTAGSISSRISLSKISKQAHFCLLHKSTVDAGHHTRAWSRRVTRLQRAGIPAAQQTAVYVSSASSTHASCATTIIQARSSTGLRTDPILQKPFAGPNRAPVPDAHCFHARAVPKPVASQHKHSAFRVQHKLSAIALLRNVEEDNTSVDLFLAGKIHRNATLRPNSTHISPHNLLDS